MDPQNIFPAKLRVKEFFIFMSEFKLMNMCYARGFQGCSCLSRIFLSAKIPNSCGIRVLLPFANYQLTVAPMQDEPHSFSKD